MGNTHKKPKDGLMGGQSPAQMKMKEQGMTTDLGNQIVKMEDDVENECDLLCDAIDAEVNDHTNKLCSHFYMPCLSCLPGPENNGKNFDYQNCELFECDYCGKTCYCWC